MLDGGHVKMQFYLNLLEVGKFIDIYLRWIFCSDLKLAVRRNAVMILDQRCYDNDDNDDGSFISMTRLSPWPPRPPPHRCQPAWPWLGYGEKWRKIINVQDHDVSVSPAPELRKGRHLTSAPPPGGCAVAAWHPVNVNAMSTVSSVHRFPGPAHTGQWSPHLLRPSHR